MNMQQKVNKKEKLLSFFKKEVRKNYKNRQDALPIINLLELMIEEYQYIFGWIDEAYKRFIIKGSRGSGKTTFAAQFILINMLLDPKASWICIMENKVQHSDTTMLEIKTWIDIFDLYWIGYASKWEKSDSQSSKEWKFHHNGNFQKIKFIGLGEADKGTLSPPSKNYWRGFWIEEPVSSREQFGIDVEKKEERYSALQTLRGSCTRFLKENILPSEKDEEISFLEIWSFNPYNAEEPALKNFNKYLPDNEEKLKKYGFDYYKNEEEKEVYITTNYKINPFLPKAFINLMEETERKKVGPWKTICYGMNGVPSNTIFSNIYHIMNNHQLFNSEIFLMKGYIGFKSFFITIDIGNGGEGQTAMLLWGVRRNGERIRLREFGTRKYERDNGYNVDKIVKLLWVQINDWMHTFADIEDNTIIPIILDYDLAFKSIFEKAHHPNIKGKFRIRTFKEKYKTAWKQEKRPAINRYLITLGITPIYKALTPKTWNEYVNLKTMENGKIQEKNIDFWDSSNLAIFYIAKEVAMEKYRKGEYLEKEIREFLLEIN